MWHHDVREARAIIEAARTAWIRGGSQAQKRVFRFHCAFYSSIGNQFRSLVLWSSFDLTPLLTRSSSGSMRSFQIRSVTGVNRRNDNNASGASETPLG